MDVTPPGVIVAGSIAAIIGLVAVALVLRRHPAAPLLAEFIGVGLALGLLAVHVPPKWGPFRAGVSALDWASVAVAVAGGLAFALAGRYAVAVGRAGTRASATPRVGSLT
jgi:hypothetical protein